MRSALVESKILRRGQILEIEDEPAAQTPQKTNVWGDHGIERVRVPDADIIRAIHDRREAEHALKSLAFLSRSNDGRDALLWTLRRTLVTSGEPVDAGAWKKSFAGELGLFEKIGVACRGDLVPYVKDAHLENILGRRDFAAVAAEEKTKALDVLRVTSHGRIKNWSDYLNGLDFPGSEEIWKTREHELGRRSQPNDRFIEAYPPGWPPA